MSSMIETISFVDSFLRGAMNINQLNEEIGSVVWESVDKDSLASDVFLNIIDFTNGEISEDTLNVNLKKIIRAVKSASAASWGETSSYVGGTYRYLSTTYGTQLSSTSQELNKSDFDLLSA